MLAFVIALALAAPSPHWSSTEWRCTEERPLDQGSGTVRTCEMVHTTDTRPRTK